MTVRGIYARVLRCSATATAGTAFLLGGCDPSVQSAVESGIINVSTTLLTSVMTALGQVLIQ